MRTVIKLQDGWHFTKQDTDNNANIKQPKDWECITLPHTWNAADIQREDNEYYRGNCWYYREVKLTPELYDKQLYLEILAASSIAQVYVNGQLIGRHETGFATFRFDITKVMKKEETNTIVISVDNRDYDYVYPRSADFTFEGGLYRGVNLVAVAPAHFAMKDYGSTGIYITPKVTGEDALVQIHAICEHASECDVQYEILDHTGTTVSQGTVKANEDGFLTIRKVHVWNAIQDPYLYTLHAVLLQNNEGVDELSIPFGVRSITFDPQQGVSLNGVKTYMKGVSRHQDHANCGWSTTPKEMLEDIELIKEIGSNSIRLAHYQHHSDFYDLCDQHGLMVWAEIPFISVMSENPKGHDICRLQLMELIKQNYNHPSIFCWGISNEITIGGESELVYERNVDLNELAHSLDTSRPTTMAHMSIVTPESRMNDITDIEAYNHYFGWYGGKCEDMEDWLVKFHEVQPHVCLGISEYGAEGILQYHTSQPKRGDYSEEYQMIYHEKNVSIFEKMPWLWGSYVWNMFDFSSKIRNEGGKKAMNNKGLVTFDRKVKKDAFYVYKAHWSDMPFVHITGRRYALRAEEATSICVYSNCSEIELIVNGVSLGTKQGSYAFAFDQVVLQPGENQIQAISGNVSDEITLSKVEEAEASYVYADAKTGVDNWFDEEKAGMGAPEGYYSVNDKIEDLLREDACRALIDEMLPGFSDNPLLSMGKAFPFSMVFEFIGDIPKELGMKLNEELNRIKK